MENDTDYVISAFTIVIYKIPLVIFLKMIPNDTFNESNNNFKYTF